MFNSICIIPLRSKSKSIKNKNIKKILGVPLCIYVLHSAIKSNLFKKIIIASDSSKYFSIIKSFITKLHLDHRNIFFFKRSKKSSTNHAQTEIVLYDILKKIKNYKYCYLLQATSPLLLRADLVNSFKVLKKNNYDSMFSAYITKKFLWAKKKSFCSLNYNYQIRPMRQKKQNNYIESGAFYAFKTKEFIKYKNRLFGKIGVFEMPEERSIDIDEPKDFDHVSNYISKNFKKLNLAAKK
jgi:CMP-N-acetylneuraminic acid synthetase